MSIFVINQNVRLESIEKYRNLGERSNLIVSTQLLFENERNFLRKIFYNLEFKTFADYLNDDEMSSIDNNSYTSNLIDKSTYIGNIKQYKNLAVIRKVLEENSTKKHYILSDGLGISKKEWIENGFKFLKCEYYYVEKSGGLSKAKSIVKQIPGVVAIWNRVKRNKQFIYNPEEVFSATYNNRKYVFLGKMSRIGYRFDINFRPSKEECDRLNQGNYETKEFCTYITTWHEQGKCHVPDDDKFEVRWAQDGYLPPNYSHKDYYFKPNNVKYYCWDYIGTLLFKNQNLPYEIIPFRKKLYLPDPVFPQNIKNILIVASGSGDWTALKNRSDDDIMIEAIVQMAKRFPDINFTYRCHPTWVHPNHVGVNSINRVQDYFEYLGLDNLKLSSNIPPMGSEGKYQLSFSRTSLDEDLKLADFVIGEHSISMIDAAFKGIPFFSINLTRRRNFFEGINDLGFPYCSSFEEVEKMIMSLNTDNFKKSFLEAVKKYNEMTDME